MIVSDIFEKSEEEILLFAQDGNLTFNKLYVFAWHLVAIPMMPCVTASCLKSSIFTGRLVGKFLGMRPDEISDMMDILLHASQLRI